MSWLALLGFASALLAAGFGVLRILRAPATATLAFAAGAVALHAVLLFETVFGRRWSFAEALVLGALGVIAVGWRRRFPRIAAAPLGRVGWGDGVAIVVVLALAVLCARAAIDNPDFVYHWGAKGRKFATAAGIDFAFLGAPSGWHLHPDYPNLLPELFATTARLGRGWSEGVILQWTPLAAAGLLLALREALRPARPAVRQIMLAATAVALLAAAFAFELAGNADLLVSWALVLALPALLAPRSAGAAARAGIAAALAASSKIEGVPLAGFLIVAFLLARRASRSAQDPARVAWSDLGLLLLPASLVVGPWLWLAARHALFLANTGMLSLARLAVVVPELLAVLWSPAWSGLPLTLVALPWLCADRRTRWAAWVCVAQLAFYLWIYASAPADSALYVQWSFARLLLHVLPAVWILCALAWAPADGSGGELDEALPSRSTDDPSAAG